MDESSTGAKKSILLAVMTKTQLLSVLKYLLDENEFLSPYGIRSLSKVGLMTIDCL